MKKVISIEKLGIYARLPDDLNELLNGQQVKALQEQVAKKPIRFIMYRGKLAIQIGPKMIFNVSIKVDNKNRKYVLVIDDENA
jgi:transcription antitermination factor NusA-like protein